MPKIAKELSPLEVSRLDKTGFNAVGVVPGLGLQIRGQARSWILRVKIGDKVRDIGLGGYPGVTLAMAREAARQLRSKLKLCQNLLETLVLFFQCLELR